MLTHLSLFSGIGGLDLAAEWAGITTVGQCEFAEFPTRILQKHWPDVPRWNDVRELNARSFYEKTGLRTVDILSGGFPCQPFSVAGKHNGTNDDRFLWPEMLRVIRELLPTWVVGENVPGIINLALDEVLFDLEGEGYETQTLIIPAAGVGAWHRRERVCILAYLPGKRIWIDGTPENVTEISRQRNADGIGKETDDSRLWRADKSGMAGMVSRLLHYMEWPDPDAEGKRLEGLPEKQIRGGGYITETS